MSTYNIEVLPDEHTITIALTSAYSVKRDQPTAINQLLELLDASTARMFLVLDVTKFQINIEDLLFATNEVAHRSGAALVHHKTVREIILVSPSNLWHLTARGMSTNAFGNIPMRAFNTLDEARAYVRNPSD